MTPITKPRSLKVRLPDGLVLTLTITPEGMLLLREPYARRQLSFPIARIHTLAALAAADEQRHK